MVFLKACSPVPCSCVFDRFKGQCTQSILFMLDMNGILFAIVPEKCTDVMSQESGNFAEGKHLEVLPP